jgi:hypothetical protein
MYLELTPEDTIRDLQSLLFDAIPGFEFPRKALTFTIKEVLDSPDENTLLCLGSFLTFEDDDDSPYSGIVVRDDDGQLTIDESYFNHDLTDEEINILAILMMCAWL